MKAKTKWTIICLIAINIFQLSVAFGQSTIQGNTLSGSAPNPNQFLGSDNNFDVVFKANDTTRMRILQSNGYVGIGTTIPRNLQHLHIASANDLYTQFTNATTGNSTATSGFRIGIDANGNAILRNKYSSSTNGTMNFYTADLERMRISNAGNVGIGTILPRERLEVNGNILVSGRILVADDGNTYDLLVLILQLQNEVAQLKQQLLAANRN